MQKFFKVLTFTRNILRQRLRQKSPDPRFDPQFSWFLESPIWPSLRKYSCCTFRFSGTPYLTKGNLWDPIKYQKYRPDEILRNKWKKPIWLANRPKFVDSDWRSKNWIFIKSRRRGRKLQNWCKNGKYKLKDPAQPAKIGLKSLIFLRTFL